MNQINNYELFTLSNALNIYMSAGTLNLRKHVFELIKPIWKQAIGPDPLYYKFLLSNTGHLIKRPAFPFDLAISYMQLWIPNAIKELRKLPEFETDLILWDRAERYTNNQNVQVNSETCILTDDDWLEI